jgi:hypothetical protein
MKEVSQPMTTVINNPPSGESKSGMGMGFLVGIILLVVAGFLFFMYGLPALRQTTENSAPQINVPDQIDVNINK